MPIKWSAVRVNRACDEVEGQLKLAQAFTDNALAKVREARHIPNLPSYIDERFGRLEYDIREKFGRLGTGIDSIRQAIPDGAVQAEIEKAKHGSQQGLEL